VRRTPEGHRAPAGHIYYTHSRSAREALTRSRLATHPLAPRPLPRAPGGRNVRPWRRVG